MVGADHLQTNAFRDSGYTFGNTQSERDAAWLAERSAYYALVTPRSIVSTAHMSRVYNDNTMELTNAWLQTVTGV